MRTVLTMILVIVATLLPVCVPDSRAAPDRSDLTGQWSCDDGGTYYLRQVGNELWWSSRSGERAKKSWANVFHGTISGNEVSGSWVDDPAGDRRGAGKLTLEIVGAGKTLQLKMTQRTGGFSGKLWTPQR